jgi:hypothetical protein
MHGHVQGLVSVFKRVTMLAGCTKKKQRSVVGFLRAKGLDAKDSHKEMFPAYGGKCLSHKAVHNWVKKISQGHSKVTDTAQPGRPVEILTGATVQRVEELIRADRTIMIDSVATALGCSHGVAYSKLLCCGFRCTGKAMGQVYQCWWGIC